MGVLWPGGQWGFLGFGVLLSAGSAFWLSGFLGLGVGCWLCFAGFPGVSLSFLLLRLVGWLAGSAFLFGGFSDPIWHPGALSLALGAGQGGKIAGQTCTQRDKHCPDRCDGDAMSLPHKSAQDQGLPSLLLLQS